jgi:hypothetical protein
MITPFILLWLLIGVVAFYAAFIAADEGSYSYEFRLSDLVFFAAFVLLGPLAALLVMLSVGMLKDPVLFVFRRKE